jgi:hypothetical protein
MSPSQGACKRGRQIFRQLRILCLRSKTDTPTTDRTTSGARFFEVAHFSVRTLEKGAHLRRNLRDFPRCAHFENAAHLRSACAPSNQGEALDPVPLTRKVAQSLVSASLILFGHQSCLGPMPQALGGLSRFVSMREGPAGKACVKMDPTAAGRLGHDRFNNRC